MLRNNIYNIDREFNYATVKSIVVKSLEKIAKEEALNRRANMPQNVIFDFKDNDYYPNNVKLSAPAYLSFIEAKNQEYDKISKLAPGSI
jgi:hypothetical protein